MAPTVGIHTMLPAARSPVTLLSVPLRNLKVKAKALQQFTTPPAVAIGSCILPMSSSNGSSSHTQQALLKHTIQHGRRSRPSSSNGWQRPRSRTGRQRRHTAHILLSIPQQHRNKALTPQISMVFRQKHKPLSVNASVKNAHDCRRKVKVYPPSKAVAPQGSTMALRLFLIEFLIFRAPVWR